MFTKKSLVNLIFTVNATQVDFKSMITLTYPKDYPVNGLTVKEDLRVFLQWLKRCDTEYLWFLEFQERGAPHFHVLTEFDVIPPYLRKAAAEKWTQRIVDAPWFLACFRKYSKGKEIGFDWQAYKTEVLKIMSFNLHETFWELEKKKDGMRHYAAKYAAKTTQKDVPTGYTEVGRFWGSSGGVKPSPKVIFDTCEDDIRGWLERAGHKSADFEILPKFLLGVRGGR